MPTVKKTPSRPRCSLCRLYVDWTFQGRFLIPISCLSKSCFDRHIELATTVIYTLAYTSIYYSRILLLFFVDIESASNSAHIHFNSSFLSLLSYSNYLLLMTLTIPTVENLFAVDL